MSRWLWSILFVALVAPSGLAAPAGWEPVELAGISFNVPKGAEVTSRELPEKVSVIVVTHKDEVLIITLYRGKSPPAAKQALSTHADEFEQRVAKKGSLRLGRDTVEILGKSRNARTITHGMKGAKERSTFVAIRLTKTTFVAAWTTPAKLKKTLSSRILGQLRFN